MARESRDIPHSMRKVYRRFERWRSAHTARCRFRSAGSQLIFTSQNGSIKPRSNKPRIRRSLLRNLVKITSNRLKSTEDDEAATGHYPLLVQVDSKKFDRDENRGDET